MTPEEKINNLVQYIIKEKLWKRMTISENLWFIRQTANNLHKTPTSFTKLIGHRLHNEIGDEYTIVQHRLQAQNYKEKLKANDDKYNEWLRKWGAK